MWILVVIVIVVICAALGLLAWGLCINSKGNSGEWDE